jgi:hypothetical protein
MADTTTPTTLLEAVTRIENAKKDILTSLISKASKLDVEVTLDTPITDISEIIDVLPVTDSTTPELPLLKQSNIVFDAAEGTATIPADYKTTELTIALTDIDANAISGAERDSIIDKLNNI